MLQEREVKGRTKTYPARSQDVPPLISSLAHSFTPLSLQSVMRPISRLPLPKQDELLVLEKDPLGRI